MKIQNRNLIIFIISLVIIFNTITVYGSSNNETEINYLTESKTKKIEKLIEENMSQGDIPGLSVTIVKEDKIYYQRGFGYADIAKEKIVNSQTLFELASNSKAFTALGILTLEKKGQIKLTDEVSKYIPWLKVNYKGKEIPLTIEQVLHQTSGINSGTIDLIPISDKDSALEETVRTLIGIELDNEPGKFFQYATINYDILGLIIEKVTGDTFENFIDEFILSPLELNNTYLFRSYEINDRMASGYKTGFLKPRLYEAPTYRGNKPAGYIISSGEDMGKWLKIQMGAMDHLNFDKEIIKKSHKATSTPDIRGDEVFYGGGWFIEADENVSHSGMNPNYSSFVLFTDEIGVAVLGNLSSNYVYNIALGIDGILGEEPFEENISDSNQILDRVAIGIIFILSIIILLVLFYGIKFGIAVNKKERFFRFNGIKDGLKFIISFSFVLGITYLIYILPNLLSYGGSWKTAFVWSPISIKIAVYLLFATIWICYLYFILISLLKKKQTHFKNNS